MDVTANNLIRKFTLILLVFMILSKHSIAAIREGHPRIWLTPQKISQLKERAARNTTTWQRLKLWCDEHINDSESSFLESPGYATNLLKALNFAIVYKVTEDKIYGDKALNIIKYVVNNPPRGDIVEWFSYYRWYPVRYGFPPIALTLDWCWEIVSESDRKLLCDNIRYVCEGMLLDDDKWEWHDPASNYFIGDMWALLCGAYVLANEPGYESDVQRYLDYAKMMLEQSIKYTKGEEVIWENWGNNIGRAQGGMWDEGTAYGCVNSELLFSAILATMTAENNITYENYNFPNEVLEFYFYATTPDGKYTYSYGDGAAGIIDATVRLPIVFTIALADKQHKEFGQYWLNHYTSDWTLDYKLYNEFIWYDDTIDEIDYTQYLPDYYFAEGGQVLLWRDGWEPNSTWMVFRMGLVNTVHGHNGFGNFFIYKGDYLIKDTAVDLHEYELYSDLDHNVLYIPLNQDKRLYWGASEIEHLLITDKFIYYAGDLSNPYLSQPTYRNNTVSHKEREFFLIKNQKLLFIMDRGESFDESFDKIFQMYVNRIPENENNFYRCSNGYSDLLFKNLYPQDSEITFTEYKGIPLVQITTPSATRGKTFLTVLKVAPIGSNLTSQPADVTGANLVGGIVRSSDGLSDYLVAFSNDIEGDPIQSNNFTITFDRFSNIIHMYIMNCIPNNTYYVKLNYDGTRTTIQISTNEISESIPINSNSDGMIQYTFNISGEEQPILPPSGIKID